MCLKLNKISILENGKIKYKALETIFSKLKIKNSQTKCGVKNVRVGSTELCLHVVD